MANTHVVTNKTFAGRVNSAADKAKSVTTDSSGFQDEGTSTIFPPNSSIIGSQIDGTRYESTPLGRTQEKDKIHFDINILDSNNSVLRYKNGTPMMLRFKVNPNSFDRAHKKTVNREQTRGGWVEYHGGDELDIINVSGVTDAFFTTDLGMLNIKQGRKLSHGWNDMNAILSLFRSNGSKFDRRGMIYEANKVLLSYDVGKYYGLFESLTVTESTEKPYSFDYSFTYVITDTLYRTRSPLAANHKGFMNK